MDEREDGANGSGAETLLVAALNLLDAACDQVAAAHVAQAIELIRERPIFAFQASEGHF